MAGRKPKLNAAKLGNRTKEELEEAEMRENGLKKFEKIDVDYVPPDLSDNAKKEWQRIIPLLQELPIAELDFTLIKKYCELVDINDDAYRYIQVNGYIDPDTNKKSGTFMVYMESMKELRSICGSLGLTIDSRLRLVVPSESEVKKSVYDEFGMGGDDD